MSFAGQEVYIGKTVLEVLCRARTLRLKTEGIVLFPCNMD